MEKLNKYSSAITQDNSQPAAQAMLYAIGFSDEDGDGENDEGVNLFVDMCRNGVDFDASIAIIKSAGIDCKNIDYHLLEYFYKSLTYDEVIALLENRMIKPWHVYQIATLEEFL